MPRPKYDQPTPGELEVLKILWERGSSTVREVMEVLNQDRERAYTSVMSLMNVMAEKGLVNREPEGRAFRYDAAIAQEHTLKDMVGDMLGRAFEGSASSLVSRLLDHSKPTPEELDEIRRVIKQYEREGDKA